MDDAATTTKAPGHLWLVGILALLFNAGGVIDYVMMRFEVPSYIAQLTDEMLAYYESFPLWMEIAWAVSVWSAFIGCVLLLMRNAKAVPAFMIASLAYLVAAFWTFGVANPPEGVMTTGTTIFSIVIGVQIVLLWYYSRAMTAKGVLR